MASDGRVLCIRREGEAWTSELIAELEGEQIQCAVGDPLPGPPGLELVTVGVAKGGEDEAVEGLATCRIVEDVAQGGAVAVPFGDRGVDQHLGAEALQPFA